MTLKLKNRNCDDLPELSLVDLTKVIKDYEIALFRVLKLLNRDGKDYTTYKFYLKNKILSYEVWFEKNSRGGCKCEIYPSYRKKDLACVKIEVSFFVARATENIHGHILEFLLEWDKLSLEEIKGFLKIKKLTEKKYASNIDV